MKSPVLFTLGACLLMGGCASDRPHLEAMQHEQNRQDHMYCVDYGTVPGTPAYDRCRENRATGHPENYSYNSYDRYGDYSPSSGGYVNHPHYHPDDDRDDY